MFSQFDDFIRIPIELFIMLPRSPQAKVLLTKHNYNQKYFDLKTKKLSESTNFKSKYIFSSSKNIKEQSFKH